MGVTPGELFSAYERRVLDSATPQAQQPVFQHLVHDRANNLDLMQFRQYAIAIASFLTSPDTLGPISISIQAPWGAGKSSLMHQVRELLDPRHVLEPEDAGQEDGRLSTRRVFTFLNTIRKGRLPAQRIDASTEADPARDQRLTVWFNAWKYESAEQVWAGLVDTIVTQVSARLAPVERELFLLRLNLARIDDGLVRQKLYDRVAAYWWTGASWILAAAVAVPAAVYAFAQGIDPARIAALTGTGLATALASWLGIAWHKVKSEPAAFSLSEYVRVPDYGKAAGVMHHIHQDLDRIIGLLPQVRDARGKPHPAPIVIFIDDLDRCAPNKVAAIVEGINAFLAGDRQAFMFVIGMDPQMVAAALEHAHKDVRSHLPRYEQNVPLGWRFMDKFIQLAFTIPPRRAAAIGAFVHALTPAASSRSAGSGSGSSGQGGGAQPAPEAAAAQERAAEQRQQAASRTVTDESGDVRALMMGITAECQFSPRDIKRILNQVRFVLLLRLGRLARSENVPPLALYQRWILLCIRWPDMARWLQWGGAVPVAAASAAPMDDAAAQRLYVLEQAALAPGVDAESWACAAGQQLGLPAADVAWLDDPALHRFFVAEGQRDDDQRLSHGASIGFY